MNLRFAGPLIHIQAGARCIPGARQKGQGRSDKAAQGKADNQADDCRPFSAGQLQLPKTPPNSKFVLLVSVRFVSPKASRLFHANSSRMERMNLRSRANKL